MSCLRAVVLFLLMTNSVIHAQNADTIKLGLPVLPVFSNDSLKFYPKSVNINPIVPVVNDDVRKFIHGYEKPVNFKLNISTHIKSLVTSSYSKFLIPTAMISYGIIAQGNEKLKELDHSTHFEIKEHYSNHIHFDDYSQFAPAVAVYCLDLFGTKPKHNFRDRTIVMATSHIIMCATVQGMKNTIGIERPDGSNNNSFPSGHTATAFVGAHILFKEYMDTSPWIGIAGYTLAATTGSLRVINKKHWISDVVTGAGIGILSAELGYLLLPVFHDMLGIKNKKSSLVIAPTIGVDNYGVGLAYSF